MRVCYHRTKQKKLPFKYLSECEIRKLGRVCERECVSVRRLTAFVMNAFFHSSASATNISAACHSSEFHFNTQILACTLASVSFDLKNPQ